MNMNKMQSVLDWMSHMDRDADWDIIDELYLNLENVTWADVADAVRECLSIWRADEGISEETYQRMLNKLEEAMK